MIKRLFTGLLLAGLVFVGSTGTALALSPAQGTDLNSVEWRLTELRWNVGNLLATIESLPVRNASEIQVKIGLLQQALSLQTLIERLEGLSTPPVQPPFEPPLDLVQPILTLASVTNGHPVLNWTNQSNVLFTLYRRQGSTDFDFLAIPKPDAPDCDGNTTSLCRVLNGLSVTTATDSTVKPSGVYTYAVLARKNVESSGGASSWISNRVQATSGGNQAMVPVITSSQTTAQIGSDDEIVTTWSLPYSGTNWQWRLYNSTGTYLAPNGGISDGAAPTGSVAHSFTKIYYQNIDLVPGFYLMKLCSESVIDTQLCSNTVSFNLTAASASRTSISNVALSETNTTSTDSTSLANPTKLRPGTTQRVKWVDAHPVFTGRTYKIELLNNGSVYAPLAFAVSGVQYVANSPYHRYYDVSIPANLSGNGYYQLRVGITPSPTITPLESMTMNTSGQLTLASSPTTGSLRVTAPNGGEKWQIGSTHTILWTPYNPQNNVNTAFTQVEAYLDKVVNGQFLNVGRIVESGKASIHWVGDLNVNGNLAQPGDYYVRVVNKITGQTDRSDSPFKLVPQGTISVNLKLDGSENEIRNLPANGKQVLASWTSNAENGSCVIYVDVFGEQGEQYANLPATGSKSIFLGPHTGSVGINCTATTPIEGTANDKISVSQANASIRVSFPNQSGTSLRFDDQTNIILDTNKISRVSVALYKNDASYRWIARDFPVPETQRLQVISWRPSDVLTASEVVSGAVYKIYVIGFANDGTGGTVEDKSDAPFKFSELPPPPVVSNDIRKIITIDKGTYANGENITVSLKLKNLGTSRATISPNGCVVPNSRIYLGSTGADIEPLVYSQPNPVACTMALVELGPGEERTFTRTVPVGGNAYPVTNGAGYNLRLPYANSTYYLYFTVTNTTQTITPWIGQFSLGSNSNWSVGTSHTFTWTSRDLPATSKIHVTYSMQILKRLHHIQQR